MSRSDFVKQMSVMHVQPKDDQSELEISTECRKTLFNALVTSHIDYGNSLLYKDTETSNYRLQIIHNFATQIISETPKH